MACMGRSFAFIAAAVMTLTGSALAQDPLPAQSPMIFNVDRAILTPFLSEPQFQTQTIDRDALFVASSVLAETGSDNAALTAFSGQSTAINAFDGGARIEVRVFQPTLLTRSDRLFDPASGIDPAVIQPERERRSSVAVDYVTRFESYGGADGLDLTIEPHAGVSFGPEGSGAGAGAELRVGRYLRQDAARPSWYFFAGAERRALLYDPAEGWNMRGAMTLEPYAVVGDAQAGVAMRLGENDLSFAYVRRERTARIGIDDYDAADDFAAFSLSRRW